MRELLFRAWDGKKMWTVETWEELQSKEYQVMQSTGLKDKNGVLIYEGDILKFDFLRNNKSDERNGLVEFHSKSARFVLSLMENNEKIACDFSAFNKGWSGEIVGNIYEHSHLLENNNTK